MVIGIALVFSVIGAATVPAISDKTGRRQPFILMGALVGLIITGPFLSASQFGSAATMAGVIGLLQTPSYVLLVALSAEFAGPRRAGLANAIMMFAHSLGGLIIAVLMQLVGHWFGWGKAAFVLIGAFTISFLIALKLGEPNKHQKTTLSKARLST